MAAAVSTIGGLFNKSDANANESASKESAEAQKIAAAWKNRDQWMPEVEFNGRPYVTFQGEKIPCTKVQYKLFEATDTYTTIIARIYTATKKFRMNIPKGSTKEATYYRQTQLIEGCMKETVSKQISEYNQHKKYEELVASTRDPLIEGGKLLAKALNLDDPYARDPYGRLIPFSICPTSGRWNEPLMKSETLL